MQKTTDHSNSKNLSHKQNLPFEWIKNNLFSTPFNSFLTILSCYLLYISIPPMIQWAFLDANWFGTSREACTPTDGSSYGPGACWVFILVHWNQFMYGFYPKMEQWRPNLAGLILVGLIILLLSKRVKNKKYLLGVTFLIYPFIVYVLLYGSFFGLVEVQTSKWGGLMLTLTLAIIGMVVSFPLGILLALGRRSNLPFIKSCSVIYIEFWRGVPLITVLFMSSVMLPLFLPEGTDFDKMIRASIGIILFQSATMAEVIRGGLQAIPKGQYEAGDAIGLTYPQKMIFIILPQVLKLVIPGIVNTFIALFKDITLVYIVGLFDILEMVRGMSNNPEWLGYDLEGYVFTAFVFWAFCYGMSKYSQSLEVKLRKGHKK